MAKAQPGDKIKLIKDICYGSIYGRIERSKGDEFVVKERNYSDDGIIATKTISLENNKTAWLTRTEELNISIWDNEYTIID